MYTSTGVRGMGVLKVQAWVREQTSVLCLLIAIAIQFIVLIFRSGLFHLGKLDSQQR